MRTLGFKQSSRRNAIGSKQYIHDPYELHKDKGIIDYFKVPLVQQCLVFCHISVYSYLPQLNFPSQDSNRLRRYHANYLVLLKKVVVAFVTRRECSSPKWPNSWVLAPFPQARALFRECMHIGTSWNAPLYLILWKRNLCAFMPRYASSSLNCRCWVLYCLPRG